MGAMGEVAVGVLGSSAAGGASGVSGVKRPRRVVRADDFGELNVAARLRCRAAALNSASLHSFSEYRNPYVPPICQKCYRNSTSIHELTS